MHFDGSLTRNRNTQEEVNTARRLPMTRTAPTEHCSKFVVVAKNFCLIHVGRIAFVSIGIELEPIQSHEGESLHITPKFERELHGSQDTTGSRSETNLDGVQSSIRSLMRAIVVLTALGVPFSVNAVKKQEANTGSPRSKRSRGVLRPK